MGFRRAFVVLAVAAVSGVLSTSPDVASFAASRSSVRLCGRRLADLVWMICLERGGVHSHVDKRAVRMSPPVKRYPSYIIYKPPPYRRNTVNDDEDTPTTTTASPSQDVFRPHYRTNDQTGGIVEECCRKSCSFRTLTTYCARPSPSDSVDSIDVVVALTPPTPLANSAARNGFQSDGIPPTLPPPLAQAAAEVSREHNEVESHSSGHGGRIVSAGSFRKTSPAFVSQPRIGTFSRHQPYWIVLHAAFDSAEEEGPSV